MTEQPHDYTHEPALDGRSPGGIVTDDGGRPVVDAGGRPIPLDYPSADEVEAQAAAEGGAPGE